MDIMKTNPSYFAKHYPEDEVVKVLERLDKKYHKDGNPNVSDEIYDVLKDSFYERNPQHSYFDTVGTVENNKNKVKLPIYMGSINKIKSDGTTLNNFIQKYSGKYVVSDKLDGISALYVIKKNTNSKHFEEKMYTRGNGYEGQDISRFLSLLHFDRSLLKNYIENKSENEIILRGELIISKDDFKLIQDKGANPRNLVAGSMNTKNPNKSILKYVQFIPYALIQPKLKPSEQMIWFQENKINPVFYKIVNTSSLNFQTLSDILIQRRNDSVFEIDGLVIHHDAYYDIVEGQNPSYAFAFKTMVKDNVAEVIVKEVEWNISKNGKMIPVILFDSVSMNGVVIRRTTGFNAQYIDKHCIGPGSRLLITRSGDVIPYIVDVLSSSSTGKPMMPKEPYSWNKTKMDIIIENQKENKEVAIKNMISFFNKIKVPGFSSSNIRKMFSEGFDTPKKILYANKSDFQNIIGNVNGEKIYSHIEKSRDDIDFKTLLEASNLLGHGFGERKINIILKKLPKIQSGYIPKLEELVEIEGISVITAEHFIKGLKEFFEYLEKNPELKNIIRVKDKHTNNNDFDDLKENEKKENKKCINMENEYVIFTGFRDNDLSEKVENCGGTILSSMSKKTTILVYKTYSDTSQKIKQAKAMGNVKIMSKEEFETYLQK